MAFDISQVSDFVEHHIGGFTAILAAAAITQWWETRKTSERQLRAYVLNYSANLFDGGSMEPAPFVDRAGQPGVVLGIKNFGQTPAYQVVHWCEMQVAPIGNGPRIGPPATLGKQSPSMLGPGHAISSALWLNRALSTQEIEGIKSGSFAIYAYGRVEYIDAFKHRRWSTYKLRYANAVWPPVGKGGGSMTFCQDCNEAN
jgi:hypothetical protein